MPNQVFKILVKFFVSLLLWFNEGYPLLRRLPSAFDQDVQYFTSLLHLSDESHVGAVAPLPVGSLVNLRFSPYNSPERSHSLAQKVFLCLVVRE